MFMDRGSTKTVSTKTVSTLSELVVRVEGCIDATFLEEELELQPFQNFHDEQTVVPQHDSLPQGPWAKGNFPLLKEKDATAYLKVKVGILRTTELA